MPFTQVTITPGKDFAGQINLDLHPSQYGQPDLEVTPEAERAIKNYAIMSLAGYAAQKRYNPKSARGYHWQKDRENAADWLGYLVKSMKELEAYLKLCLVSAETYVECDWPMIEALAKELLARKTLSGSEIEDFLRRCKP